MVNLKKSLEKLMTEAPQIAQETNLPTEAVEKVFVQAMVRAENNKRQPVPPPPEGGISLSDAKRKYGVSHQTLSRWVKRGYIQILLRTNKELYISKAELGKIAEAYLKNPGQGKRTLKRYLNN